MLEQNEDVALLQKEIGEWSYHNFGKQQSKVLVPEPNGDRWEVCLGSLAPAMGLVEEIGEMISATTDVDILDAVGDVLIYLCDYTWRERVSIGHLFWLMETENYVPLGGIQRSRLPASDQVVMATGRLFHCTLKRHQGIRGYDIKQKYEFERDLAILSLLRGLSKFLEEELPAAPPLLEVLKATWNEIVKKRDWKRNPQNANESTETA